jgi:hypothetical protein
MMVLLLLVSADVYAQKGKRKKALAKKPTKTAVKKKATPAKRNSTTLLQRNTTAGDTALKGATIEIIQSYKPQIKMAEKPEQGVNLPPVDTTVPSFTYEVPQQTLSYNYTSFPLRPLALGTDSADKAFHNYAKVGGGNLSTLMLDAGIGSLRGKDYETQFHASHLSQKGGLANQKVSLTGIEADGTLHRNGNAWHGGASFLHNQYHYYGYDPAVYTYSENDVKQSFTGIKLGVDMKNEVQKIAGLNYNPSLGVTLYGDRHDAGERTIQLGIPVSYDLDTNVQLSMGINMALTQFEDSIATQSNNIVQFTPSVSYRKGSFKGKAGLYPTLGKSATYLLPDIQAEFTIPGSQFGFMAGWQGRLRQNTYEQLSTRNPFMFNNYTIQQTQTHEVYGGIKSNIGNHISFTGKLSWWQYNNLPMYVNDTATDNKQFNILYDGKVNALAIQAAIRYEIGNTFSLGLSGTWQSFTKKTYSKVWHEPGVIMRADAQIKPLENLTIAGYFSFMDEIYALKKSGISTKLNATTDLGVSGEYQLIQRLSVFLQVNNLLNAKNERWLGYPSFGTNVFGGLRLKF